MRPRSFHLINVIAAWLFLVVGKMLLEFFPFFRRNTLYSQVDAIALINLSHLHNHLLTDGDDVFHLFHAAIFQLRYVNHSFFPGQYLYKAAHRNNARYLSAVNISYGNAFYQSEDPIASRLAPDRINAGYEHASIVFYINGGTSFFDDTTDHLATRADDSADVFRIDANGNDSRCPSR